MKNILWCIMSLFLFLHVDSFVPKSVSCRKSMRVSLWGGQNSENRMRDKLRELNRRRRQILISILIEKQNQEKNLQDKKWNESRLPRVIVNSEGEIEIFRQTDEDPVEPVIQQVEKEQKNKRSYSGQFECKMIEQDFSNIGGYREIRRELNQIQDYFNCSSKYKAWNVRVPRGVLLYGPPGNGKTLLAKCFAGESKLPMIATAGSEFQEKYVGTGSARIRELFEFASENSPCILFIDEIDAIARHRSSDGESASAERDSTLNQLLIEMDGIYDKKDILIIGSTNRIDILDHALLRPGRFDKKVKIDYPDEETRREIVKLHMQGKPIELSKKDEIWMINDLTAGLSGAEIEHLLNEAALYGIRKNILPVNSTLLQSIHEMIKIGLTSEHVDSQSPQMSEETAYRIALHEMGHVFMSYWYSSIYDLPEKCTIESKSRDMLGYTIFERQKKTNSKEYLEAHIQVLLAGRIVEEIFLGEETLSTGCSDDLKKAEKIAYDMLQMYGMGKDVIYPILSEESKGNLDKAVRQLILEQYEKCHDILSQNREKMEDMTRELLMKKTLHKKQLTNLWKNNRGKKKSGM